MTTSTDTIPALDDSVRVVSGSVRILDRRVFPETVNWVEARDAEAVAEAIRGMVTQSSGPLFAAYAALELTALQVAALGPQAAIERMRAAGRSLVAARPTNIHPHEAVHRVLVAADSALAAARASGAGDDVATAALVDAAVQAARSGAQLYRDRSRRLGEEAAALLPDGARLLTHCWMDTYLIEFVRASREAGKRFDWVATETRPYLQGARLTAHTLAEFGEHVTLITDGMGAAALAPGSTLGRIDVLVTAADRVAMDGSVVNKVGTLGLAVAANAFGVPFYALVQAPDAAAPTAADIVVEERDPAEVLNTLGRRTASELVTDAWYPAFDVTPAPFVSRIVTDRGSFEPSRVGEYFAAGPDPEALPAALQADAGSAEIR
jgi:methylthioribose-1-phosphate isomerase